MTAFLPVGEVARWRLIYQVLKGSQVDDVITYERMAELLELDPTVDRHVMQMAMRRAAKEFEQVDKHAVDSVRNVGYRVVRVTEHIGLARRQQRKAGRALESGHSKVVNVDFNGMDPEVRKGLEVVARAFAMQMDFNRRFDVRQRRLEKVVKEQAVRSERSEEEIAELKQRLARLEEAG